MKKVALVLFMVLVSSMTTAEDRNIAVDGSGTSEVTPDVIPSLSPQRTTMVDDDLDESTVWPVPTFHFEVKWYSAVMYFQEVSGLDLESEPIEYRRGDSPQFSVIKMPGLKKYSDVTMKKGVFKSDKKFWDWYSEIKMNTIKRKPVTITLLDESGKPIMMWVLANAWPNKVTGTDLNAAGEEVAVETIVISHEGVTTEAIH